MTLSGASAETRGGGTRATATAFTALFSVVGLSLYGLPLYYDFMVRELGWSRTMVTSGNAISKLIVGPLFGFAAGWIVDRFGPRRLMMAGIVMAGGALVGLGTVSAAWTFYVFYFVNALGYVCGGPLPRTVMKPASRYVVAVGHPVVAPSADPESADRASVRTGTAARSSSRLT